MGQQSNHEAQLPREAPRPLTFGLRLLPAALTIYLAYEQGGFYAQTVAYVTLVLAAVLLIVVLVLGTARERLSTGQAVVITAFAGFAAWTLASALWAHAWARVLVSSDRVLLYLFLLAIFAFVRFSRDDVRTTVRLLAAAIAFVCITSWLSRVLPGVWPTSTVFHQARLSYPIGYWNGLGILAAVGILLLVGLASDRREHSLVRALFAAAVPVLAAVVLLTYSRGALGALTVGLVVFALTCRSATIFTSAIAIVPPAAVALVVAYRANVLATNTPTSPPAVLQGDHVAIVTLFCVVAAFALRLVGIPIDRRLTKLRVPKVSPRAAKGAWAAVLAALVAAFVVAGGPGLVSRDVHTFLSGAATTGNIQSRLTSVSSNNRSDNWQAALKGYAAHPITGTGAGTYEYSFYRYRHKRYLRVINAHSLYLETLSELGPIGVVLLLATLFGVLRAFVSGLRTDDRLIYAAMVAAGTALLIHVAVDWDWQQPAVTAWFFVLGGLAVRRAAKGDTRCVTRRAAAIASGAVAVCAIVPGILMFAESDLQQAVVSFNAGDCRAATKQADAALGVTSALGEADQIVGFCDIQTGRARAAVAAMDRAVSAEPRFWLYRLDLSAAQALDRQNPREELEQAETLAPGDPLVESMVPVLAKRSPAARSRTAEKALFAVSSLLR